MNQRSCPGFPSINQKTWSYIGRIYKGCVHGFDVNIAGGRERTSTIKIYIIPANTGRRQNLYNYILMVKK